MYMSSGHGDTGPFFNIIKPLIKTHEGIDSSYTLRYSRWRYAAQVSVCSPKTTTKKRDEEENDPEEEEGGSV